MDGYVEQALNEFKHTPPKQHFKGPSQVDCPDYGQKVQYVKVDTSPAALIKYIQQVTGKFLYYVLRFWLVPVTK